jgi:hypothetical protein
VATKSSKFEQTVEITTKGITDIKELLSLLPQLVAQLGEAAQGTIDTAQGFSALGGAVKDVNAMLAKSGSAFRLSMPRQQASEFMVPVADEARAKKGEGIKFVTKTSPVTPARRASEAMDMTDLAVARAQASNLYSPTAQTFRGMLPAGSIGSDNWESILSDLRSSDRLRNVPARAKLKALNTYAREVAALDDDTRQSPIMGRFLKKGREKLRRGDLSGGLETVRQGKIAEAEDARRQTFDTKKADFETRIANLDEEITAFGSIDPAFASEVPGLKKLLSEAAAATAANDHPTAQRLLSEVAGKMSVRRVKQQMGATVGRAARGKVIFKRSLDRMGHDIDALDESITGRTGLGPGPVSQLRAELKNVKAMPEGEARSLAQQELASRIDDEKRVAKTSASKLRRSATSSTNSTRIKRLMTKISQLTRDGYLFPAAATALRARLSGLVGLTDANAVQAEIKAIEDELAAAEQMKAEERSASSSRMFDSNVMSSVEGARDLISKLQSRYTTPYGAAQLGALGSQASSLEGLLKTGGHEPELKEASQALDDQIKATQDSASQTKKLTDEVEKLTASILKSYGQAPLGIGQIHEEIGAGRFAKADKLIQDLAKAFEGPKTEVSQALTQEKAALDKVREERKAAASSDFANMMREKYGDKAQKFIDLRDAYVALRQHADEAPEGTDLRKVRELRAETALQSLQKEEDIERREAAALRAGAQYRLGLTRGIIRAETALGSAAGQIVSQDIRGATALPVQSLSIGSGFMRDYYQNEIIAKGVNKTNVAGFVTGLIGDMTARIATAGIERGMSVLDRASQRGVGPRQAFESLAARDPGMLDRGLIDPRTGIELTPRQKAKLGVGLETTVPYKEALDQALAENVSTLSLEEARRQRQEAQEDYEQSMSGSPATIAGTVGGIGLGTAAVMGGATLLTGGVAAIAAALTGAAIDYFSKESDREDYNEALTAERVAETEAAGDQSKLMTPAARSEAARRAIETLSLDLYGPGRGNVTRDQMAVAVSAPPLGLGGAFSNPDPEGILSRMNPAMREEVMRRHRAGVASGKYSNDNRGILRAVDEILPQQYRYGGANAELANKYGLELETLVTLDSLNPSFGIRNEGLRTLPGLFGEGGFGFSQSSRNAFMRQAAQALESAGSASFTPELMQRGSFFLAAANRGANKQRMAQGYIKSISAMQGVVGQIAAGAKDLPEQLAMAKALSEFGDVERAVMAVKGEEAGYTVRDREKDAFDVLGRQAYGYTKLEDYTTSDIDAMVQALTAGDKIEDINDPSFRSRARSESLKRGEGASRTDQTDIETERGADKEQLMSEVSQRFDKATASFADAVETFVSSFFVMKVPGLGKSE